MKGWSAKKEPVIEDDQRFTGKTWITVTDSAGHLIYDKTFNALSGDRPDAVWGAITTLIKAAQQ